jgi:DNA-binding CsgD family transcriptional regulator
MSPSTSPIVHSSLAVKIASIVLSTAGIILLVLNILLDWRLNLSLPLVFLVLGGGFFYLAMQLRPGLRWAPWLFIPGALTSAFGIIFLLNVITGDWNAWAYAWLLLLAGIGIGLLLANRDTCKSDLLNLIGWCLTLAGITFFALFGVITGGLLIQVIAPVILVVVGVSLRWLKLGETLPKPVLRALNVNLLAVDAEPLVDPLSSRELEVLQLIADGSTNQQIAYKLTVSQSTVKTHINNIYGKLGVQSRVQAVNRARELGLTQTRPPAA